MARKPTTIRVEEDLIKAFREKVQNNNDSQPTLFEAFIRTYLDDEVELTTEKSRLKISVVKKV